MLNKKVLAAAVIGSLFAGNAVAQVVDPGVSLDDGTPLTFASELRASTDLTGAGTADDFSAALGYNFSIGEVRYGRFECTSNIQLGGDVEVSSSNTAGSGVVVGSVNGINSNALFFSLTKGDEAGATDAIRLSVSSDNILTDYANVNCGFSIYDQPSQAQAGGTAGRIYTTGMKPYITRASGVTFVGTSGTATANVSANPAYTQFVSGNGSLGTLDFSATEGVLNASAVQIELTDIFAAATTVTVTGDFSAADSLTWAGTAQDGDIEGNVATFEFDGTAINSDDQDGGFTYVATGEDEIQVSTYVAALNGVAASDDIILGTYANQAVGAINRNGTQLQAPLVQVPAGWIARIALTNTGSEARPYTLSVMSANADGTTTVEQFDLADDVKSGEIPANGTKVIRLNDASLAAAARRGTVNVTVDGPSGQINGLYQVVNPNTGLVTNHVLARPAEDKHN